MNTAFANTEWDTESKEFSKVQEICLLYISIQAIESGDNFQAFFHHQEARIYFIFNDVRSVSNY